MANASTWILASALAALIGGTLAGRMIPALVRVDENGRKFQVLERQLADRKAFARYFEQTVAEWQCGAFDLHEASLRILDESWRTFPQYLETLRRENGDDGRTAELVADNIQRRVQRPGTTGQISRTARTKA